MMISHREGRSGSNHVVSALARCLTVLIVVFAFFTTGCQETLTFHRPNIIASAPDGSIVALCDLRARRILVSDRNFRHLTTIEHPDFDYLWGLDVSSNEIAVVNKRADAAISEAQGQAELVEVMIFNHTGYLLRRISWPAEEKPVDIPGAINLGDDGSFIMADSQNHRISLFSPTGEPLGSFGTLGRQPENLYYPTDVHVAHNGNLVVTDSYNSSVKLFSPAGELLKVIAAKGEAEGSVSFPVHSTEDRRGFLYCTELSTMRVSVFDADYNFVHSFSPKKNISDPENSLRMLFGITVLEDPMQVLVVDSLHSCIYVFDETGRQIKTVTELSR